MRKYRVEITKVAERDIESIVEYIHRDNPMTAIRWIKELERQIGSLEKFPSRCPIIPEAEELEREYRHLNMAIIEPSFVFSV
ncbi:type II toxin-antitoxin system RelE/ParE family toxin [candidate division NPL-UPA2 bacterium]|nr:type II toxin-antitoxin system RelE/ParE family toxin [candidate division NPL-UPA2 bacterium]